MLPLYWRRLLRAVRVMFALSCAAAELSASEFLLTGIGLVFLIYALYGIVALGWRNFEDAGYGGVALGIDAAVLFASLVWTPPHYSWVSIALFTLVICTAAVDYDWWLPLVIGSLAVVVINFASPGDYAILFPVLAVGGILGSVVAAERQARFEKLNEQSVDRLKQARHAEQQRMAADFHDGPMQSFVSFQLRVEIIRKLLTRDPAAAEQELLQLQDLSNAQVHELRAFVRTMRPVMADASLNASLRRAIDEFTKDSGIPVSFVTADFAEPLEPEVAVELLQIVREALTNVKRHSGATRVAIGVNKTDHAIELSVEDNGNGFPFIGKYTLDELELLRLGPGSIKRRVRALGGELLLESKSGQGAGLRVRLSS